MLWKTTSGNRRWVPALNEYCHLINHIKTRFSLRYKFDLPPFFLKYTKSNRFPQITTNVKVFLELMFNLDIIFGGPCGRRKAEPASGSISSVTTLSLNFWVDGCDLSLPRNEMALKIYFDST